MKIISLVLPAALLVFGGAAHAGNRDVTDYLQRAGVAATADLAAAGVEAGGGLTIRARVSSDGRLIGARVVTSSGSLETDQAATKVLRRLRVNAPPNVLVGADVNIAVGPEPLVQAQNPRATNP
ncbi:MAG: energy transducer TonB [Alphaproteobacteria bacterium]|nr:energy transducer TonB [Alphaproteobacteria bacterium]MBU1512556.1 energy transducer TonB [Alphaproteobacteria bacterium]MBU2092895.1 energy transducer TonB [Alphaproteobacteria bacterium]MBU2150866.1 energy transducer TonB [Alphaproteobacteria bacterium]MBU2307923.1 energy transducer TonB [Alphaproteobacteria bacterium]